MADMIQAVRGMNDLLPEVTPAWQALENALRELLALYGYGELRLPILETDKPQAFWRQEYSHIFLGILCGHRHA